MKPYTVTMQHWEGYLCGGLFLLVGLVVGCSALLRPLTGMEIFILCLCALLAAVSFFRGASWERLDENGICTKNPFRKTLYPWDTVSHVGIILADNGRGSLFPRIRVQIRSRKWPVHFLYTKGTLAAIRLYYGEPDEDQWGRPPDLL